VDFERLQESLAADWNRGRFVRGGSTITQQLAKNLYLSPSKNPLRKLQELLIARRLEAELKKSRILELYLNVIEVGRRGVWGGRGGAHLFSRLRRRVGAIRIGAACRGDRQPAAAQSGQADPAAPPPPAVDSPAHGRGHPPEEAAELVR